MKIDKKSLTEILEPSIVSLGYELWGIELLTQPALMLVRVYIDSKEGVSISSCVKVNNQIKAVIDAETSLSEAFTLEVSSPGLDRPLFKLAHYALMAGENAQITLFSEFDGKKRFQGILKGTEGNDVILIAGEDELLFPIECIKKANLLSNYEALGY